MSFFSFLAPKILKKTAQWLVVSKPPGMLTVPSQTTQGEALSQWAQKEHGPIWIVHRLDRETSGVVLMARSEKDHQMAGLWFQNRKVKKIYHALVSGIPDAPILKLNTPIRGKASMTQVEVLEKYQEGFFAQLVLRTGRRHQIRIHLSQRGYCIWGDSQYGGVREVFLNKNPLSISRVALHASQLELPTGECFVASFEEDFSYWLCELKRWGSGV